MVSRSSTDPIYLICKVRFDGVADSEGWPMLINLMIGRYFGLTASLRREAVA